MTYFLMLLFVWVTLFCISVRWLTASAGYDGTLKERLRVLFLCIIWASLGTFFFHNIW